LIKEARQVRMFVQRKIHWLTEIENESAARALLAKLRRGIAKMPGSMPELWEVTLKDLPLELMGKEQEPSYSEWAVHTALTLFALHQQGKNLKIQCMNQEGEFLGIALRRLIDNDEEEKRIKRRFDAAATSSNLEEFSHHLRGLIQLLRAQTIPLDYPTLAEDLYWFQFPNARDTTRLRWGRDFYRLRNRETDDKKENLRKDEK